MCKDLLFKSDEEDKRWRKRNSDVNELQNEANEKVKKEETDDGVGK